jgi:uncharacterized FlaG/YvyC family protein
MEVAPASRMDMTAPITAQTTSQPWLQDGRQVIAAVQWLNQAQWLGQDRELTYKNDPKTGRFVIQILERQTGDVVDQIPPESVLRLVTELQAELKAGTHSDTTA